MIFHPFSRVRLCAYENAAPILYKTFQHNKLSFCRKCHAMIKSTSSHRVSLAYKGTVIVSLSRYYSNLDLFIFYILLQVTLLIEPPIAMCYNYYTSTFGLYLQIMALEMTQNAHCRINVLHLFLNHLFSNVWLICSNRRYVQDFSARWRSAHGS